MIPETAPKLSIALESLRRWVEPAEVDTGKKSVAHLCSGGNPQVDGSGAR